jgi:type I restriction enzyme, S subunit
MGPNTIALKAKGATDIYYLFSLIRGLTQTKEYKRHWNELTNNEVRVAPLDLTTSYGNLVRPLFQLQENLQRQSRALRSQRDLLLPPLISGELAVADAVQELGAVA